MDILTFKLHTYLKQFIFLNIGKIVLFLKAVGCCNNDLELCSQYSHIWIFKFKLNK